MDFTNIQDTRSQSQNDDLNFDDELGDINPTVIKIIGCGGGGSSAVQRMIEDGVSDVQFIVLNTDKQALHKSSAQIRVPIGQKITGGLGAGGNPKVGEDAANEDSERIQKILQGANMVVITAGMGGGTGTGSAPVVAQFAHEAGILTIAVVTTPFSFEGTVRMKNALEGLEKLRENVDSLIVLPNDLIFKAVKSEGRLTFKDQFKLADNILCAGVKGVTELITKPGPVNLDFADVSSIMKGSGDSILGVGRGKGENRINDAVEGAIANPLLENRQIDGARKILINITTNGNLSLEEAQEISNSIKHSADKNANVIWGLAENPAMEDDDLAVTVIATDFNDTDSFGIEPSAADEKIEDDVFDDGTFQRVMQSSGHAHAGEVREEPSVSSGAGRFSSFGATKSSILDSLETIKSGEPEEKTEEETENDVKAASSLYTGRTFSTTTNMDLKDDNTPAIFRRKAEGLSRSIDLTQQL